MLVLSRRTDERIIFANLGVTVQVLQVKHNQVKLGIEAPPSVRVLRQELQEAGIEPPAAAHSLANLLNKMGLTLHLLERQWQLGKNEEAAASLAQARQLLEKLTTQVLPPIEPLAAPPAAKKCRTLIVDDDTNERELLAGLLSMNGCDCSTAGDGLEALDYLAAHQRPDFVLMDMWMPRCDGRQALHAIRENPRYRDLKVFVVSGSSPQEAGIDPGRDGYDAWFQKPLNPRKLWEAIQKNLTSSKK